MTASANNEHDLGADQPMDETAAGEGTEGQQANSESPPPDESPSEPVDELTALRDERDRLDDQLKRAMADLANFKRRQLQEAEQGRRAALEGVMRDLVGVVDIFGHALTAYDGLGDGGAGGDSVDALVQGVRMTQSMLMQSLERHGLQEIPSLGQTFDPNLHEAAGFDSEASADDGTITKVLLPGYKLRDVVLRASRVLVAGKEGAGSSEGNA